jgi:mono/diheme cytochrome c family protein
VRTTRPIVAVILMLFIVVLLAACGAGGGTPAATLVPIPTPKGAFAQATTVITPETAIPTTAASGPDLALGQRVWDGKCASCHGAKGEGVADKGKGIGEWEFTAQEFEDLLRTGQKGKLGSQHLYGPDQISPSGIAGLYAYVQSLSGQ